MCSSSRGREKEMCKSLQFLTSIEVADSCCCPLALLLFQVLKASFLVLWKCALCVFYCKKTWLVSCRLPLASRVSWGNLWLLCWLSYLGFPKLKSFSSSLFWGMAEGNNNRVFLLQTIPNKQPKGESPFCASRVCRGRGWLRFLFLRALFFSPATGPTHLSLGRATPSRAVSPMGSRVTVATASLRTLRAMARAATVVLMDRPRTVSLSGSPHLFCSLWMLLFLNLNSAEKFPLPVLDP